MKDLGVQVGSEMIDPGFCESNRFATKIGESVEENEQIKAGPLESLKLQNQLH